MTRRRLLYAAALLGAVALRVSYTGWLAGIMLWAVVCLPLLGVLTALPGLLACRMDLSSNTAQVTRGGDAAWVLAVENKWRLPLGRVRVTLESRNAMTGEVLSEKNLFFVSGDGGQWSFAVPTGHCGLLTGQVSSAWALDSLGLFWLPLAKGKGEAALWVLPLPRTADLPPLPEEAKPGLRPKPGGGPGEDYDPRPYRPGDPLNTIHWKLSAKRDELVTRETLETIRPLPLLTFDCFGAPETMDALLEVLSGTSAALLRENRPHAIAWAEPVTGEARRFTVSGAEDWERCLQAILSQPCPIQGRSILDAYGLGKSCHLTVPRQGSASKGGEAL